MRYTAILSSCLAVAFVAFTATSREYAKPSEGGIVTLYHLDPLAHNVSFRTGEEGGVFQDHMVKNNQSDLNFGHFSDGEFAVGIEGGHIGSIIDLGSSEELRVRYGYSETVGGGQGFASLRVKGEDVLILANYEDQSTVTIGSIDSVFGELESTATAPIHVGHTYLVRLGDRHDSKFQRIVKFIVLRHDPGIIVTLRWQLMLASEAS